MACLPKLIQDIQKKKNARRYCATHKLHYYTICPLCDKNQVRFKVKGGKYIYETNK